MTEAVGLKVNPEVASVLGPDHRLLGEIERDLGVRIEISPDPALRVDQYDLVVRR